MILAENELQRLTGKVRPKQQRQALDQMHIPYKVRLDGHPLVAEESVRDFLGIKAGGKAEAPGVDFKALQEVSNGRQKKQRGAQAA